MGLLGRLWGSDEEPEPEPEVEVAPPPTLPAPPDASLDGYLGAARDAAASDLHLVVGSVPFCRVHGELLRFDRGALEEGEGERLADELRRMAGTTAGRDRDFCVDHARLGRFRVNLHRQRRGMGASLKVIARDVPDLEELGLPSLLYDLTDHRLGLVLVTGPGGCGKSSTLAALVQHVNETRQEHVITIEDPIEFVFESAGCNITQRQVGPHTGSFGGALRAALREDPDVILVSELRDLETIRTALVAAETGHLVLGTLHTRDSISTIHRLLDLFPPRERNQVRTMLAGTLRTVVSQRLLPRKGGGWRVPAYEILNVTTAVATKIRDGRTHQIPSILQTGKRHGMVELDSHLGQLVKEGLITEETAYEHAKDPSRFGAGAGRAG